MVKHLGLYTKPKGNNTKTRPWNSFLGEDLVYSPLKYIEETMLPQGLIGPLHKPSIQDAEDCSMKQDLLGFCRSGSLCVLIRVKHWRTVF